MGGLVWKWPRVAWAPLGQGALQLWRQQEKTGLHLEGRGWDPWLYRQTHRRGTYS